MTVDETYLQQVLRTVSHDMGGALRISVGFSRLILENAKDLDNKTRDWLQMIGEDGERMQSRVAALSRYARLYDITDAMTNCNLNDLCRYAMEASRYSDSYPDFTVQVDPLPIVTGYERFWIDFFSELLANSAQYSGDGEHIRCRVYSHETESHILIAVEDNGRGLTQKQIAMAIMPFRTLHDHDHDSAGMGLPVAKRIAELQGGEFDIRPGSNNGEHGLTVTATLPKSAVAPNTST